MSNLIIRTLTGSLFVVLILGSILLGYWAFFSVMLGFSAIALNEFYRMSPKGLQVQALNGIFILILIQLVLGFVTEGLLDSKYLLIIIVAVVGLFIFELYRKKEKPFENIAWTILGLVLIAFPFSILSNIFHFDHQNNTGAYLLIAIFSITWMNDTGAYLVGTAIGKHRLFERISPKKSWEGSIGGAVVAILTAYLFSIWITQIDLIHWVIIAIIITIFANFGDLVESLLKRSSNVKDSGSILPGHGGVLDRFDATLFAAPLVWVYIMLFLG
ncbi:MAG: phosphatidate cytidylyltransferase [Bacteroidales bacterium]|nr:phosphatidate cytidylyltransferase [Bacteroidales bacterium]